MKLIQVEIIDMKDIPQNITSCYIDVEEEDNIQINTRRKLSFQINI